MFLVRKELINELKGSVAQRIKDQATKGVQRDINGLPYVETKSLDTIINQLDKSDKLDLLFGKKGAEYYRTINDATKKLQDMYGSSYKFEVEKNSPRNQRGVHLFKIHSDGEKEKLVYTWPIKIGKH